MSAPEMEPILYPSAVWQPLLGHSVSETIEQRNLVVLHITEGTTASGAIETFKRSTTPRRVSAHFVIDRDGKVYQLLDLRDTAWHASQANKHSIGIEHVALSALGAAALNKAHPNQKPPFQHMPATEAQYQSSALLIAWLAQQLNIPVDRQHIRSHNEASPRDRHALCCTGALDPDKLVRHAQQFAAARAST